MKVVPINLQRDPNAKPIKFRLTEKSQEYLEAIMNSRSHVESGYRSSPEEVLRVPTGALVIQQLLKEEHDRITKN